MPLWLDVRSDKLCVFLPPLMLDCIDRRRQEVTGLLEKHHWWSSQTVQQQLHKHNFYFTKVINVEFDASEPEQEKMWLNWNQILFSFVFLLSFLNGCQSCGIWLSKSITWIFREYLKLSKCLETRWSFWSNLCVWWFGLKTDVKVKMQQIWNNWHYFDLVQNLVALF